jgi:hypothetical protein
VGRQLILVIVMISDGGESGELSSRNVFQREYSDDDTINNYYYSRPPH